MKQIIIMLFIILFSTTLVYSKGSSEISDIDIAKQLIEEKKYDEAIKLLTTYSIENPKSIYEVQELLDTVRVEREKINTLMDDLITAIYDEEDFEKGDLIINKIKDLNPNPDQLSKVFLRNARDAATFVVNRKKFKTLMDQALEFLKVEEYNNALDIYLLCLDFHRDEFDLLMEDNETTSPIENVDLNVIDEDVSLNSYYNTLKNSSYLEVNQIKSSVESLKNYIILLQDNMAIVNTLIEEEEINNERLVSTLESIKEIPDIIDNFTKINSKLFDYNELFSKITIEGSKSNFITYATLTLDGRSQEEEGILYIINSLFPRYINDIVSKLENRINSDYKIAVDKFDSGLYDESTPIFNSISSSLKALRDTTSLWKIFIDIDDNLNITGRDILVDKYSYYGDSQVGLQVIDSFKTITQLKIDLESFDNEDYTTYRNYINENLILAKTRISEWNKIEDNINKRTILKYKKAPLWIADIKKEIEKLEKRYIDQEITLVSNLSRENFIDIFEVDSDEIVDGSDAMGDAIRKAALPTDSPQNIKVFFDINNTDERELLTYNPETALENLENIELEYSQYITKLEGFISKFENEKSYIFENKGFSSRFDSALKSLELATVNRDLLNRYKNEAINKITLSKESENRGVTTYQNALNAFEREDFNVARELIETGKTISETAISYSNNSYVINELIPSLYRLNDEIKQEEARIVIRDVRQLITLGKTQYLEGAYIPASDLFKEAELRWAEINTEPHPEIPYWLALTRDALAIESGRYLSVTEPLYSILAGYLSFAENAYREGVKEENKVNKLKSFAVADSYLLKVLEVRPLNERARFLQLQVLKSKDPESFKVIFRNDFNRYRSNVLKAIENVNFIEPNNEEAILLAYEEIVRDAYRLNPRYSGSRRRVLLERFYTPTSTVGKSKTQIDREKSDIEDKRKIINESYTRFKDLLKIAEDDQKNQVQQIINLSEVALGFKRLPVDTSNIRESDAIFVNAQNKLRSIDQTDIDSLRGILTDLQKALSLNPNNQEIPVVIDDILVMLGEESNFQLAPNEDRLFREAQKDFIEGNYFEARDKILIILRANDKNKNYPKLKELINRVEIKIKVEITI
ncbi:hypothetical protein EW093_00525 [Thiospirochaeta perfilievii]|uniref:Uncharacterized protein n=1 Tax=Thiospirochaeta perfilievii TaxID=252967 RepID=A0A5C1Q8F6_9SPIO|nr:hypothetical protein [Thiospirochaeta perfilievii]QEN03249.1 hypothetical protein EW093_00525 [Thiospirochaeta perfilievii]